MGKLIVIEGTDSSGKETQTKKLYEKLFEKGVNVKKITFPNYESPACAPVKMYLAGEFGTTALSVNPYPASTMYAIDRYASYKKEWERFYLENGVVVTDRYTQSNMIHQASKITDKKEKEEYMKWLVDLEFNKMEIPKPDMVIFINMPFEFAQELMKNRENKITGEMKKDIHEKDVEYMKKSYLNACEIAKTEGWVEISCVKDGKLRTIEEISEDIFNVVESEIFGG
ncbi:deoxynucleoside kinase [Fusobacterium sp.]|uniref:dTMP kinase n=1 Tax=Fusobacterium sp. TaxID=68766 RepID=UPI00261781DF|nr:deoxynucleoside kinase [Fusobacterium sp.]